MKKKTIKQITAISLMLITFLSFGITALAAPQQVYATTWLNLRTGPGTNFSIAGSLDKGQVVTRIGQSGNWSLLQIGNARLYASSNFLKPYNGGNDLTYTMYTTGRVNVRTGPGTGYKVLDTLKKGTAVTATGTVGNWTIISWKNGAAYMYTSYLKNASSANPDTGVVLADGTMKATTNVNVRKGPGTSHAVIGWLQKGDIVNRTGVSGNWTMISYNGNNAYVHSAYLELINNQQPPSFPIAGIAYAPKGATVYEGHGDSFKKLGTLSPGEGAPCTIEVNGWTQINYNNGTGYVSTSDIVVLTKANQTAFSQAKVQMASKGDKLSVYTIPSDESNQYLYGYMTKGEKVTRLGFNSEWSIIFANGRILYTRTYNLV